MRRTALVVLFLLLAAVASPALAQQAASVALASSFDVGADFDNDGFADLAVGVPGLSTGPWACSIASNRQGLSACWPRR